MWMSRKVKSFISEGALWWNIPPEDSCNYISKCFLCIDENTVNPEDLIDCVEFNAWGYTVDKYSGKSYMFCNDVDKTKFPLLFWFCEEPMPQYSTPYGIRFFITKLVDNSQENLTYIQNKCHLEISYIKGEDTDEVFNAKLTKGIKFTMTSREIIHIKPDENVILTNMIVSQIKGIATKHDGVWIEFLIVRDGVYLDGCMFIRNRKK